MRTTSILVAATAVLVLAGTRCIWVGQDPHRDWSTCDVPSDCTLASDSCCDPCGRPTLDDVDAVNRWRLDHHFDDVCPVPQACPACPTAVNPELVATCGWGACQARDVRDLALSACTRDADCRLRVNTCCECGGSTEPWNLIAIAVGGEAAFARLVCDPGAACARCLPLYPDTVEAFCADDGHCAVRPANAACTDDACRAQGLTCCADGCVATYNDVRNCGACGNVCGGAHPYCDGASCTAAPPCQGASCTAPAFCCGAACCGPGQLCCDVPGPGPGLGPRCVTPDASGTCPVGCPLCQ